MRRTSPRVVCLGNLFRDQLDRYGELEHIAERWRSAVAGLGRGTTLVANADDPLVASLAEGREGALLFGVDDPRLARSGPPARVGLEVLRALRAALSVRRRLRGPSRRLPLPPVAMTDHRSTSPPATSGPKGWKACPSVSGRRRERRAVRLAVPGLYNVYNALGAASPRPRARGPARRRGRGPRAISGGSGDSSVSGWPTAACSCCS